MIKKYLSYSIAAACAFTLVCTLQSCTKLASLLNYDLMLNTGSVKVVIPPYSDTSSMITLGSGTNSYNVDSFIKANTAGVLGVSNIKSVKLSSCTLTIETRHATSTNNFANIKSCTASFYSNSNTTPYSISLANIPDSSSTYLSLPVDSTKDLSGYISGTTFTYSLAGKLRRATTDTIICTVKFAFNVNVKG